MLRLDSSLPNFIFQFACILVLGMVTMFFLEHNNYMQYWHKRLEIGNKRSKYNASVDRHLKQNGFNLKEIERPRILCWIPTPLTNLAERAKSVKDTWGKRCNMLLFFSSKADSSFPAIGLNVEEGSDKLFNKTRASLRYIYQRHINDVDWFLKADDDTYVIMENLRYFLSKLNPSDPHFIGRILTTYGRIQHWRGRLRFQPRNVKNIQESAGRGWLQTRRWWTHICSKLSEISGREAREYEGFKRKRNLFSF